MSSKNIGIFLISAYAILSPFLFAYYGMALVIEHAEKYGCEALIKKGDSK